MITMKTIFYDLQGSKIKYANFLTINQSFTFVPHVSLYVLESFKLSLTQHLSEKIPFLFPSG